MKKTILGDLTLYTNAHRNKWNQVLHYFAFLFAFVGWIFIFINVWITVILALLHYLFSWVGHFFFEGNKPASFRYPCIGFYAGFLWFFIKTVELVSGKQILRRMLLQVEDKDE